MLWLRSAYAGENETSAIEEHDRNRARSNIVVQDQSKLPSKAKEQRATERQRKM